MQVTFFIEHQWLALNKGHNFLEYIVGGQVDFVDEDPVTIFDSFDKISLKKAEHQVAINSIEVHKDVAELFHHVSPLTEITTIPFNLW